MMSNPLKIFLQCVLELDTPTKDQRRALKTIRKNGWVVIDGRPGSGKTYLAVHCILKLLTRTIDNTTSVKVLYAGRNKIMHFLVVGKCVVHIKMCCR